MDPVVEQEASETTTPEGTVDAAAAPPETGTSEQQYDVLSTFSLEDVPEEHRPHVELYVKQVQGDYTRKTQQLAEDRKAVKDFQELVGRLESEDTRDEAMAEFARKYGYEFGDEPPGTHEEDEEFDENFRDPRVDKLVQRFDEQEQARRDAEQAEAQAAQDAEILGAVDTALDAYAQKQGVKELRPGTRQSIIAIAAAIPRLDDGLPDMEGAITAYEAEVAAEVKAYIDSKRATVPDASGSSGALTFDPRDEKERLKAMNAIAERALARHA